MRSINRRLQLSLALALTLGALLLFSLCFYVLDRQFRDATLTQLARDADSLVAAVFKQTASAADKNSQQNTQLALALDTTRVPRHYQLPYSGDYFLISTATEQWRSRSLWDFSLHSPAASLKQDSTQLVAGPRQQQLLVLQRSYTRFGASLQVTVAADYRPTLLQLRHMAVIFAAVFAGFLVALVALQGYFINVSLRPLKSLERKIHALRAGQVVTFDDALPSELKPLVDELERLLSATETTLRRSRTHLSNLSHALKTPLAVLYSKLQQPQWRDHEQALLLREQVDAIHLRISRELARARLAGEVLPGSYFSPHQELPDLLATLKLIHHRPLQISSDCPADLQLLMDREDGLELIGNLLDNACKWAAQRIDLQFTLTQDGTLLTVTDDGPGIAPDLLLRAQTRGQRLDEAAPGHGVGLSVVQDICDQLGAALNFSRAASGGLCVTVKFPSQLISHARV